MGKHLFTILIVDDEATVRAIFKHFLKVSYGDAVIAFFASNGMEALQILDTESVDLAVIDLVMPEMDGFTLLGEIKKRFEALTVLILTSNGSIKDAVKAIGIGAADFLEKPFQNDEIRIRLDQVRKLWEANEENKRLKEEIAFTFGYEKLLGTSPAMVAVKRLISQAGPSDASVLIQGNTGTGKELVARALHFHSKRRSAPFVPVDCASLSPTLAESELFGYVKGAFTGAEGTSAGLIRAADGGTIFFDEVGELPLAIQVKLLRVLQESEVRPVGGTKAFPVDIRVLAATNRDLSKEVAAGRFREDLFYRLNVILLTVPALRDRKEDIPTLTSFFLGNAGESVKALGVSERALVCLERYDWPGNVRELQNVLRRAIALRIGEIIEPEDLPQNIVNFQGVTLNAARAGSEPSQAESVSLDSLEAAAIKQALAQSGGNRRQAAALLGIGEATLYRKLKHYGLG